MSALRTTRLSKGIRIGLLVAVAVGTATFGMAWLQMQRERSIDLEDVDRRAQSIVHQMTPPVRSALARPDAEARQALEGRLDGYRRVVGFAVYRADGKLLAAGKAFGEYGDDLKSFVATVLRSEHDITETLRTDDENLHLAGNRVLDANGEVVGALVVVHDIGHLDQRSTTRLMQSAFWTFLISLLLIGLVVLANWIAYERPLRNLADWMRRLRTENAVDAPPAGLPVTLLATESERLAASFRAARSAGAMESRSAVREHKVWTRDRLRAHALDCLNGGQLVVVSNREPYMHVLRDGKPQLIVPAGGLVTALDPVLQACGGLWVAHGAGDADRETADGEGRLMVPPDDSRYALRRVWITREQEQGYYYGLSNEGMWPLCHLAHERPVFRTEDWHHYLEVNRCFADAVLREVGTGEAIVLVQDYHLALLPQMLKAKRPDLRVGIFWHIPWANPEAFRICPWRVEILEGMLGADLIGFHLQQFCNNFLETVDRMVEVRLDWDHFSVEWGGHRTLVRPFPISIEDWNERSVPLGEPLARTIEQYKEQHHLHGRRVVVGVDRIDYTKGLAERFRAIDRFLEKHPEQRGKVSFVMLGAPSRTHLPRYREMIAELETLADEINWRHQSEGWKPLLFLVAHHAAPAVHAFMTMADVCIVSSLHDGMNLVAKEYVAAKDDNEGVLILSEFAGAARELYDALIINPYDTEQFAEAIHYALELDGDDRRARMARMRRIIEERNVYHWAADLLTSLAETRLGTKSRGSSPSMKVPAHV